MSDNTFSNADTGNKPADPYKEKNLEHPELKEKVEDLVSFISSQKFGMMTTRIASSGLLTSRCMALAGKVSLSIPHTCPTFVLCLPYSALLDHGTQLLTRFERL